MRIAAIILTISLCSITAISAQQPEQALSKKTRILFLLDGSGSMMGKWNNQSKIDIAKELLSDLVDSLSYNKNIQLGLRIYGHQFHKSQGNCTDTKLEVPFSLNASEAIKKALGSIKPKGTTPIAYSLKKAAQDFPEENGYRNIVILITDGEESCGEDPCSVSLALQKKKVFLQPFIIALGQTKKSTTLNCIGKLYTVADKDQFAKQLQKAVVRSLTPTQLIVDIRDKTKTPLALPFTITLINSYTRLPQYEFINFRDIRNEPDTFAIDPVPDYQLKLNTIPATTIKNPIINPGKLNIIQPTVSLGTLELTLKKINLYQNKLPFVLRKDKGDAIIYTGLVNNSVPIKEGIYKMDVLTTPEIKNIRVKIEFNQKFTYRIPDPGIVDIQLLTQGTASIFLDDENKYGWVMTIDNEKRNQSIILQPGNYRLVFKAENSPGKYTIIKKFKIESGTTHKLTVR